MKKFQAFMEEKIGPFFTKISSSAFITSLMAGFSSLLGLIFIGSIASLITGFQYFGWQDFLETSGIKPYIALLSTFTNGMISPLLALSIAYANAHRKLDDTQARIVSMISLISFLIVCPLLETEGGTGINLGLMGARGMFVAIFLAFFSSWIYMLFISHRWVIRLPESVPPFVTKSFESIIPGIVLFAISAACAFGFSNTSYGSLVNFIYSLIQTPFEAISGNIHGYILITFLIQLFWFFGIHGGMTFDAIKNTLFTQAALDNMAAYGSGLAMTNIVTIGFSELAGSGWAQGIGLLICMIFFCKRNDFKAIGKTAIIPQIFKISEPVRFGVPTVFNFTLMIPLLLFQPVLEYIAYFCCRIGILSYPRMAGMGNVPIFVSGFLQGGISGVIFQIFAVVLAVLCFLPFIKAYEKQRNQEEPEIEKELD